MMSGSTGAFDPRRQKPTPISTDVGGALLQKRQMAEAQGMGGAPMMDPAMAGPEGVPGEVPQEQPQVAAAPSVLDTVEAFDPAMEHSASASRVALAEGIQRAMGVRQPQNPRIRPGYNKVQLAQLGLPPAEIELLGMNDPSVGG